MPSAISINFRHNPEPVPTVRPLSALNVREHAEDSRTAIKEKWDEMELATREQVLRYFNTVPGKFTLTESQISTFKELPIESIPDEVRVPLMKAVVGWEWDYELHDLAPAIEIAFGIGGIELSEAGDLGVRTFSELPDVFRNRIVELYGAWDEAKHRTEDVISGQGVQAVASQTVRRVRSYQAWRQAWDRCNEEAKFFYLKSLGTIVRTTRQLTLEILSTRTFDQLPDRLKENLHDNARVDEISAKVAQGRGMFYTDLNIYTLLTTEGARVIWPADNIVDFIAVVESDWKASTPAEREGILRFLLEHDHWFTHQHASYGSLSPYVLSEITSLCQLPLYKVILRMQYGRRGFFLGHLALYVVWNELRQMFRTGDAFRNFLVGLDEAAHILDTGLRGVTRMDRIEQVATDLHAVLQVPPEASYLAWTMSSHSKWVRQATHRCKSMQGYAVTGQSVHQRLRGMQELQSRARFRPEQRVRVGGFLHPGIITSLSTTSFEHVKYNITIMKGNPLGNDPQRGGALIVLTDIDEADVSEWEPWELGRLVSGTLWDEQAGHRNRIDTLTYVRGMRISADQAGLPSDVETLASRRWADLGDVVRKKLTFYMIFENLVKDCPYAVSGEVAGGWSLPPLDDEWREMSLNKRTAVVLFAMSQKVPGTELRLITPTNSRGLSRAAVATLFDLPLDYIYGVVFLTHTSFHFSEQSEKWTHAFEAIGVQAPTFSDDDFVYLAVGSGVAPDMAVTVSRPTRQNFIDLPEWIVLAITSKFKTELEGDNPRPAAAWNALIARGRELAPELPAIPALSALNETWRRAAYRDRYRAVVGALEASAVNAAYADNRYQPPGLYVQAASQNDVNNIRDEGIRSALSAKFEALQRNWNALLALGDTIINQLTASLGQTQQRAESEAERRARENWGQLSTDHRGMLTRYLHDETYPNMTITSADWGALTQVTKDALTVTRADWETFTKYGAAIQLEETFNAFSPEQRRSLIAGCGVVINSAEFNGIMQMSWRAYDEVPQRFTSRIIENMVQGIEGVSGLRHGLEALDAMIGLGNTIHPTMQGVPMEVGDLRVGDFAQGSVVSGNVYYGVVIYIDKEATPWPPRTPTEATPPRIWSAWDRNYFTAYDDGSKMTLANLSSADFLFSALMQNELSNIIVYERDHPIPVLRDTWGGEMITNEQRLKRAELIAGLMMKLQADDADRLLAHLYPGGEETGVNIIAQFDVQSAWRKMPTRLRSWMVHVVVVNFAKTVVEMAVLTRALSAPYKSRMDRWLSALGGPSVADLTSPDGAENIFHIQLPIIAYAYTKAVAASELPSAPLERRLPVHVPGGPPVVETVPLAAPPPAVEAVTEGDVARAWDAMIGGRGARVLRHIRFTERTAETRGETQWRGLSARIRTKLVRTYGIKWNVQGVIRQPPRRGERVLRPVPGAAPTPAPTPPPAEAPLTVTQAEFARRSEIARRAAATRRTREVTRRAAAEAVAASMTEAVPPPPAVAPPPPAPSGEEYFQDPFGPAIRNELGAHFLEWNRAQLDATIEDINNIARALEAARNALFRAGTGGAHGVPVPFIVFPAVSTSIEAVENATPDIIRNRVWIRIKNAMRSRQNRAVVSLQSGEFYKWGKWHKENSARSKPKKKSSPEMTFPAFGGNWVSNPEPASFQMVRFRSDVHPIKVIDDFLQQHAEGWITSFYRHYNLDRMPRDKRVYLAISTAEADKPKPFHAKIIGVLGVTQNRWENIDDIFVAVHTQYRRMNVGKQMLQLLKDIGRGWQSAESGRAARRMFLMVKDANEGSKRMVTSVGFVQFEQFLNQQGETVNKYKIELYDPARENP